MTDFDDRLRTDLSADDEAFLNSLDDEPGLFAQMGATFHGPMKYWTVLVFVFTLAFTVLGVYSAWQLSVTEQTNMIALWAVAVLFCGLSVAMLKMWLFMRMNHLVTLREIKRLQLMVARALPEA